MTATDPDDELLRRAEQQAEFERVLARRLQQVEREQTGSIRREGKRVAKRKQQRAARKRNR